MVKFPEKMPDSLARLLVVFVVLTGVLATAWTLIPKPMKNVHVQWDNAILREKAKPMRYAGAHACEECHGEIYGKKKAGYHRDLSCETCHGPAKTHTEDPDKTKPAIPATRSFCVQCHAYNPSRPRGFPQINPQGHNPLKPCAGCHNPHDPKPPTTPKECSACHGEIARTKAVSHHVQLECTTCHEAPRQHKITPRGVKPTKPQNREFCGKCHAKDAPAAKERLASSAPKIDMAEHGEKYVCWQCHYPHSPEVEN